MKSKKLLRLVSLTLFAMILSSCGISTGAKLNLPPDLVYPKIKGSELQCLSDKVYTQLNIRRAMCESRVETLKSIIKSTH